MTPETPVVRARIEHLSPPRDERAAMAAEVRAALLERPLPRIPCKYFYDEKGSALFDEITRLPEYYLTRTEDRILKAVVPSVVKALQPRELFEVGSGTGTKIRLFLDAPEPLPCPAAILSTRCPQQRFRASARPSSPRRTTWRWRAGRDSSP